MVQTSALPATNRLMAKQKLTYPHQLALKIQVKSNPATLGIRIISYTLLLKIQVKSNSATLHFIIACNQ